MERRSATIACFILLFISGSDGQQFSYGKCPYVAPSATYTTARMGITWYVILQSPRILGHNLRCTTAKFTYTTYYDITVTAVKNVNGKTISASGVATQVNGATNGILDVYFPTSLSNWVSARYTVIGIDANSLWVILYGCKNLGFGKLENIIVMVNSMTPAAATITAAITALTTAGFSARNLEGVAQVNC